MSQSRKFLVILFTLVSSAASAQLIALANEAPSDAQHRTLDVAPSEAYATRLLPEYPGGTQLLANALAARLEYPVLEEENGIEGTVVLRVEISEEGRPRVVDILESLTPACDAAAVSAVEGLADFLPARLEGRAFARRVRVGVRFVL